MAKLHHVDVTNNDFLIEGVSGTPIKKPRFTGFLHPRETFLLLGVVQVISDLFLRDSVEHWSRHSESECLCSDAEMGLQDLTTFMRLGTPSGFSTISTGVPSAKKG